MILGKKFTFTRVRHSIQKQFVYECDNCHVIFYDTLFRYRKHHYCTRRCASVCEISKERQKQTCLRKYGVESHNSLDGVKAKKKLTYEKYYGIENPTQRNALREKCKETCQEKYGVDNPFQSTDIKEKIRQSLLNRYGVEHALQSSEILSKMDFRKAFLKAHQTMKKNRSYRKSRTEDAFYTLLCVIFGDSSVCRQVTVDMSLIDFYITTMDTYIQFDGTYWHGTMLSSLDDCRTARERNIFATKEQDSKQNELSEISRR